MSLLTLKSSTVMVNQPRQVYDGNDGSAHCSYTQNVFKVAISKLDSYFAPKQSKVYERHTFRLLKQEPDEKFEKFLVRLRKQAEKYQFASRDENIIDQVTEKCHLPELRKKILQIEDEITLDRVITEVNTLEIVNKQLEEFKNPTKSNGNEEVNKVGRKDKRSFCNPKNIQISLETVWTFTSR